jgi:hypothetical protein
MNPESAKRPSAGLAFKKKGAEIFAGPDAAHFLFILPAFKAIDDALDKIPAEEWQKFGEAKLGGLPSPFLQHILDTNPTAKAKLEEVQGLFKEKAADMWEVCNVLCKQLQVVSENTQIVKENDSVRTRKHLADAHERLSILATACGGIPAAELAPVIRSARTKEYSSFSAIYDKVTKLRDLHIDKKHTYSARDFGSMQQAVDDAIDFVSDLRTEVELGRISPNRHILALKEHTIDPKDYLNDLKKNYPDYFIGKDKKLPGEALGFMQQIIKDDLQRHAAIINDLKGPMALRGFRTDASAFATWQVDHTDDERQSGKLTGDMGFGERVKALLARKKDSPKTYSRD